MTNYFSIKNYIVVLIIINSISIFNCFGQKNTDSLINTLISTSYATNPNDKGINLIQSSDFSAASQFYSSEINKNVSNSAAYLNRGISNWAIKDESSACRDWSAVLALGDTAAFKLLDSHCHGKMVVDADTIPKKVYRKMFAVPKDSKTSSNDASAMTIVDQMPEYEGGEVALMNYISKTLKYPVLSADKQQNGIVVVNFIISTKGKVMYPYVKKGLGDLYNKAALEVFKNMPLWKPGKQKGKPVMVRYNLPIIFE
jgi:hypothetical protein